MTDKDKKSLEYFIISIIIRQPVISNKDKKNIRKLKVKELR